MKNNINRNSVIEIIRFIFSFFIVFYHGNFFVEIPVFCNANYFVDFFFIVSGYFLIDLFRKYDDLPTLKGGYRLLIDRLKKLGVPLLISYLAVVLTNIVEKSEQKVHILWFIHALLIFTLAFFLLYRLFKKKERLFYLIVGVILVVSSVFRFAILFFPNVSLFETTYWYDELRCVLCLPIGMLIRLIPSFQLKSEKKQNIFYGGLTFILFLLILVGVYYSSINFKNRLIVQIIMDFILFPCLFYSATLIKYFSPKTNKLGVYSIYLYIFQTFCPLTYNLGYNNSFAYGCTLFIVTTITILWVKEFDYLKQVK